MITANDGSDEYQRTQRGKMNWGGGEYLIIGHEFTIPQNDQSCQNIHQYCFDEIQTISTDGNKITQRRTYAGKLEESIYLREK